jgi:S-adenosylmethionine synthetase
MFGYACRETPELMPMPILLAHRLCERLAKLRKSGKLDYLRPDGKSQVTIEYEDNKPARIDTVVVSTQHHPDVKTKTIREDVIEHVLKPILPKKLVDWKKMKIHINPTGRFVNGGPKADTGLTGRKIIVDTYGGMGSHGGGALSGKDPSKVDRSACYAARWVAKNLVAAELCDRVEVQLAYAIGVAQPVSIMCDTMGTGVIPDSQITKLVRKHFDLTPAGIIRDLKLRRPIYRQTAAYGHFGRELDGFTWEITNRAKDLKKGL